MKIGPLEFACNFPDWLLTLGEHRLADRGSFGDLWEVCMLVCICVWRWYSHSGSSCTQLHTPHLSQACPGWLMEHTLSPTKLRPTHVVASAVGPGRVYCHWMWMKCLGSVDWLSETNCRPPGAKSSLEVTVCLIGFASPVEHNITKQTSSYNHSGSYSFFCAVLNNVLL